MLLQASQTKLSKDGFTFDDCNEYLQYSQKSSEQFLEQQRAVNEEHISYSNRIVSTQHETLDKAQRHFVQLMAMSNQHAIDTAALMLRNNSAASTTATMNESVQNPQQPPAVVEEPNDCQVNKRNRPLLQCVNILREAMVEACILAEGDRIPPVQLVNQSLESLAGLTLETVPDDVKCNAPALANYVIDLCQLDP